MGPEGEHYTMGPEGEHYTMGPEGEHYTMGPKGGHYTCKLGNKRSKEESSELWNLDKTLWIMH